MDAMKSSSAQQFNFPSVRLPILWFVTYLDGSPLTHHILMTDYLVVSPHSSTQTGNEAELSRRAHKLNDMTVQQLKSIILLVFYRGTNDVGFRRETNKTLERARCWIRVELS